MVGIGTLLVVTAVLAVLGAIELATHRRRLAAIRIRVHVNGTRGKTSVTRLIAAGLRAGGITTCAKTTGTLARMILPDGQEVPIDRPAGARIIEQRRIVSVAASYEAEALVIECMALQPELQALSELRLVRSTHGVITNARPDHLDVMGPDEENVARALAGTVPVGGKLYTCESQHLDLLREAAEDRGSEVVTVEADALGSDRDEIMAGFSYTEHPENVAIALRVCADLGIDETTALAGMQSASPDPGVLTERQLDFFGRAVTFVNGFAANDPVSTEQLWNMVRRRHEDATRRIAVFNCRADRPDRSLQLASSYVGWEPADHVVLMGTGTSLFARAAVRAGVSQDQLVIAEGLTVDEVFEKIISLSGRSALVMGMGNAGSHGLELAAYFANRATAED